MCQNCKFTPGQCQVCQVLDKDDSIKLVTYCPICEVKICKKHYKDWSSRLKAAYLTELNKGNNIIQATTNLVKKVTKKRKINEVAEMNVPNIEPTEIQENNIVPENEDVETKKDE